MDRPRGRQTGLRVELEAQRRRVAGEVGDLREAERQRHVPGLVILIVWIEVGYRRVQLVAERDQLQERTTGSTGPRGADREVHLEVARRGMQAEAGSGEVRRPDHRRDPAVALEHDHLRVEPARVVGLDGERGEVHLECPGRYALSDLPRRPHDRRRLAGLRGQDEVDLPRPALREHGGERGRCAGSCDGAVARFRGSAEPADERFRLVVRRPGGHVAAHRFALRANALD